MLTRTYDLDVVPGGLPQSIHLSQYDSDVTLVFRLYASQGKLDIASDVTAEIRGTKLDGNGISAEATFEIKDGIPTVTVQVTKQMTAIAGKNTFELVLTSAAGYDLPSANFYLDVERAALDYDTLESKSEIMEIQGIISRADEIIEAMEVSQSTQDNLANLTQRAETAAQSAQTNATAAESAKTDAVSAKDTAVSAVNGFNTTVTNATNAAVKTVQDEGDTQVSRVQSAGSDMETYAAGVVSDAKDEIDTAKTAAISAVQTAGTNAVAGVNDAKDSAMTDISDAADEITDIKTQADTIAAQAMQAANSAVNEVAGVENNIQSLQGDYTAMQALVASKVDGGYVENNALYLTSNGEVVAGPFEGIGGGGGGGGGGGSTNNAVITVNNTTGWMSTTIASGSSCNLSIYWSSIEDDLPTGNGSLTVKVGGSVKAILDIAQGNVTTDVGPYLDAGVNAVQLQVMDSYGNSRVKNFTITAIELNLTSSFDDTVIQNGILSFPYTPYGSVAKTVHFILDGRELDTVNTSVTNRQQTYIISAQPHGAHSLRVYFESTINGNTVRSNELYYEIIWVKTLDNTPVISSSFHETSITQFSTVNIPYMVYTPNSQVSDVEIKVDGVLASQITVDRTKQVFSYRVNNAGTIPVVISSGGVSKTINLNVTAVEIDVHAETENLSLYLSSAGRSNNEADPSIWTFGEGEDEVAASLTGFNWASDGWQRDTDGITALRVSGGARVTIPFKPFAQDFRSTGKTIEIEFATRDVLNYDAVILSCLNGGRGLSLTAQTCLLTSEQSSLSMQFKEDEHVRVGFVVEKRSGFRRIYSFINGIMSGVVQYPDDDDFSQVTPADITIGNSQCTVDIYCIRVYDNDLTPQQMEDNWIADTQDGALLLARYNRNNVRDAYGKIVIDQLPNDLPYFIIECAELPQYKGDKKTCSGSYTDPLNPAKSYTFTGAEIDVQGTSSQYYERKNYKLKFKRGFVLQDGTTVAKYQMRDNSIPTNVFCFKADVASSEGANNVELARLYNDSCPYKTPAQEDNADIRQGIDGFPMVGFWHDTANDTTSFLGRLNYNFDKSAEEVFGFQEDDESWEIRNNTGRRVIWKSDDYTSMGVDEKGNAIPDWLNDFEARYPDTKPPYQDPSQLQELATWLKSTDPEQATGNALAESVTYTTRVVDHIEKVDPDTGAISYQEVYVSKDVTFDSDTADYRKAKFRAELSDYVELDSALFYYLFTELFLMVDSRAKNMFPSFMGSAIN